MFFFYDLCSGETLTTKDGGKLSSIYSLAIMHWQVARCVLQLTEIVFRPRFVGSARTLIITSVGKYRSSLVLYTMIPY